VAVKYFVLVNVSACQRETFGRLRITAMPYRIFSTADG
jgi:hypothetical protein